jgi:hypothetical protein
MQKNSHLFSNTGLNSGLGIACAVRVIANTATTSVRRVAEVKRIVLVRLKSKME